MFQIHYPEYPHRHPELDSSHIYFIGVQASKLGTGSPRGLLHVPSGDPESSSG